MLVSDGHALMADDRICNFPTGTETNPVYLFDKSVIESPDASIENITDQFPGTWLKL